MTREEFFASEVRAQLERADHQVRLLVNEVAKDKRDWAEIIWRAGTAHHECETLFALYRAACDIAGFVALPQNTHDRVTVMMNDIRERIPALCEGNRAEIAPTRAALAAYVD